MKYKVGDKARVKTDLVTGFAYGSDVFATNMALFKSRIVTIREIVEGNKYKIIEDGSISYNWTDEMLEDVPNEKQITITIPEGYELDKEKSTDTNFILKKIEKKKPVLLKSWKELKTINGYFVDSSSSIINVEDGHNFDSNKNIFPTKEYAEAALALAQLLQLRQAWIGDWKPVWTNRTEKHVIIIEDNMLQVRTYYTIRRLMPFPTRVMAEDFLSTFKSMLEVAKPLL